MASSVNFDKHVSLYNHHHNQNIKYSSTPNSCLTLLSAESFPTTPNIPISWQLLMGILSLLVLPFHGGHSWPTVPLSCLSPMLYGSSSAWPKLGCGNIVPHFRKKEKALTWIARFQTWKWDTSLLLTFH